MRCPKCRYISFDSNDRCRNCGYEFSLTVDVAALDLPIQTGDEPEGPLADFALGDLDEPEAAAPPPEPPRPVRAPVPPPSVPVMPEPPRPVTASADLPLFKDRALDDDTPLVTSPAVPRAPLAVRRSSPAVSRAQRAPAEPGLNLEWPNVDDESAGAAPPPMPLPHAEVATLSHPVAGLPSRVAAAAIDLAILGSIDVAVLYFTLKICGFTALVILLLPLIPFFAFLLLLNGGYFVAFVAAGGQTIGKMATGIKVVPADADAGWGDRVPLGTAFVRAAASFISLAPAGIGLLPALFSADRRTVHDRLARTRVVKA
jgi:uncharacterized RDD family membrane protein YckC